MENSCPIKKFIKIKVDNGQPEHFETEEIVQAMARTFSWKLMEKHYFGIGFQRHVSNIKLLANIARDKKINACDIGKYVEIIK